MVQASTQIKIVVIGDAECGKTSLVQVMGTNKFLEEYNPNVADKYEVQADHAGTPVTMHIWDMGSEEAYDNSYVERLADADVIMICFDLSNKESFANA